MKKIACFIMLPLLVFAEDAVNEMDQSMVAAVSEQEGRNHLSLSIVQGDGSTVSLSDSSIYQIDPKDWDVSSGWIANPAEVSIEDTKDGSPYPFIITNKATGNHVRAALAPEEAVSSE